MRARGCDALKFWDRLPMEVPKYPILLRRSHAMAVSPIKVSAETKEQIRVAAALLNYGQAEFVGRAVDEYTRRHASELRAGIAGALSLIHISEPTRQAEISYAVCCLKK